MAYKNKDSDAYRAYVIRQKALRQTPASKEYARKYNATQKAKDARERNRRSLTLEQRKSYLIKQRYGITMDMYRDMLVAQGGHCACCYATCNKGGTMLCVDHDHQTGKVRGLLCKECNSALGLVQDSVERLNNLARYLTK